jgi:hypothetical protein
MTINEIIVAQEVFIRNYPKEDERLILYAKCLVEEHKITPAEAAVLILEIYALGEAPTRMENYIGEMAGSLSDKFFTWYAINHLGLK